MNNARKKIMNDYDDFSSKYKPLLSDTSRSEQVSTRLSVNLSANNNRKSLSLNQVNHVISLSVLSKFKIYFPFFLMIAICVLTCAIGFLLLFPRELPLAEWFGFCERQAVIVGWVALGVAATFPFLFIGFLIWLSTPSRAALKKEALFADALLEEMTSSPASMKEHYDVHGHEKAMNGTLIFFPGLGAPRAIASTFGRITAKQYRTICIDMPGHGSLASVAFSFERAERIFLSVVRNEFHIQNLTNASRRSTPGHLTPNEHVSAQRNFSNHSPRRTSWQSFDATAPDKPSSKSGASFLLSLTSSRRDMNVRRQLNSLQESSKPGNLYELPGVYSNSELASNTCTSAPTTMQGTAFSAASSRPDSLCSDLEFDQKIDLSKTPILIVGLGASCHLVSYLAAKYPHLISGIVFCGPIPLYHAPSISTRLLASLYRVQWLSHIKYVGMRGAIFTHPKLPVHDKNHLLDYRWYFNNMANFVSECGQPLMDVDAMLDYMYKFTTTYGKSDTISRPGTSTLLVSGTTIENNASSIAQRGKPNLEFADIDPLLPRIKAVGTSHTLSNLPPILASSHLPIPHLVLVSKDCLKHTVELLPSLKDRTFVFRGLHNSSLPTLNPTKVHNICDAICAFVDSVSKSKFASCQKL